MIAAAVTHHLLPLGFLLGSVVGHGYEGPGKVYEIPNKLFDGPSTAELRSVPGHFDGQRVTPWPNANSYEWEVKL